MMTRKILGHRLPQQQHNKTEEMVQVNTKRKIVKKWNSAIRVYIQVIEYDILDQSFLNCSQMNVVDVVSKGQVFNSLMACGMKLSLLKLPGA